MPTRITSGMTPLDTLLQRAAGGGASLHDGGASSKAREYQKAMPTMGATPLELMAARSRGGYSQGGSMSSRDTRHLDASEPFGSLSPGGFGLPSGVKPGFASGATPLELMARRAAHNNSTDSGGMTGRNARHLDATEPFGSRSPGGFGLPQANRPGFVAGAGRLHWNAEQGWHTDTIGSTGHWKGVIGAGQVLTQAQIADLQQLMLAALGQQSFGVANPMAHSGAPRPPSLQNERSGFATTNVAVESAANRALANKSVQSIQRGSSQQRLASIFNL